MPYTLFWNQAPNDNKEKAERIINHEYLCNIWPYTLYWIQQHNSHYKTTNFTILHTQSPIPIQKEESRLNLDKKLKSLESNKIGTEYPTIKTKAFLNTRQ